MIRDVRSQVWLKIDWERRSAKIFEKFLIEFESTIDNSKYSKFEMTKHSSSAPCDFRGSSLTCFAVS